MGRGTLRRGTRIFHHCRAPGSRARCGGIPVRRLRLRLLPLLAAMVTLAAVTVVQAGPASANESAPTLSPAQGPAGTRVTAAASDWIGCTSMSVSGWGSTLATTTINSSGAFSLSFTVPASAAGDQQLQFSPTCSHSTWMPFVTFKVTTPGSTDTSAPSVSWTSPVGNSGTFPVSSGSVTLQASASDNVGVARVKFTRWDAVAGKWVDLATVSSAPWQTTLAVSTLNSGYNQVNVQAWDAAGNASTARLHPSTHSWQRTTGSFSTSTAPTAPSASTWCSTGARQSVDPDSRAITPRTYTSRRPTSTPGSTRSEPPCRRKAISSSGLVHTTAAQGTSGSPLVTAPRPFLKSLNRTTPPARTPI